VILNIFSAIKTSKKLQSILKMLITSKNLNNIVEATDQQLKWQYKIPREQGSLIVLPAMNYKA